MALRSRVKQATAALLRGLDPAVKAAIEEAAQVRDRLVPVDTGALKASGTITRLDVARYELREGRGLPDGRAAFTEYGTSRQAAQPHMTPAAESARRTAPATIARFLSAEVRRAK